MGGGAAISAAVAAGTRVVSGGFRSGLTAYSLARNAIRPSVVGVTSFSPEVFTAETPIQPNFAGDVTDGLVADKYDAGNPRMVFGPVPSLEEAREATSELKDAIEKAFRMLVERPAVQTVVASVATDINVWNAMMQSPAMVEFLESQGKLSDSDFELQESPKCSVGSDTEMHGKPDGLRGFISDLKHTLQKIFNNLSNFAQSFFSQHAGSKMQGSDPDSNGPIQSLFTGGNLTGLVMMVIMMVLIKRPSLG